MRYIDLHTHSVYSDGTYTPGELVSYAQKKDLSAISLTDHDTIDGLDEARRQSEIFGICFINGVEINSFCYVNNRKINIHVLGYLFKASEIKAKMAKLKTLRYEHNAPPFSVVTQIIHDAGGVVSLAHPAEYGLNHFETECLVKSLRNIGLDAIECIHPSQDVPYAQKVMNLAKQNNLVITGGSDFHGKNDDGIDLGVGGGGMLVPESFLTGLGMR